MPNSALTENRTEAARALVEHLRRNPEEAHGDPTALAERFGLPTEFVRRALGRLPAADRANSERSSRPISERAGGLFTFAEAALERAAQSPIRFETISLLVSIGLGVAVWVSVPKKTLSLASMNLPLGGVVFSLLVFAAIALQMGVFYRKRMARYALYGGLVFWIGTALPAMIAIWLQLRDETTELGRGFQVFSVGLGMFFIGAIYAGLAALAGLAGGWVHLKREEWEWERLSRQELLERYFELQRRLEGSVATNETAEGWESWRLVAKIRRSPVLAACLLGIAVGLVRLVMALAFHEDVNLVPTNQAYILLSAVHGLDSYVLFGIIAFLSGRTTRGIIAGAAYLSGITATALIPFAGFGPDYVFGFFHMTALAFRLCFIILLGAVLGAGATIQRRATRDGRLQRNDGATIVAEMLEIQWRLEEDATSVTVLVVDAAKSTAMKVGADPLDVEYSFREYQMWIAECCAGYGGRIHSVAGDGAVVAFSDGAAALGAARRIQTDVTRFNGALNRLPKPFRLRLGLHAGRVAGDLNDVQFTEVIDIAAHVEDIAPVGGIAATEAVVTQVGHDGFLPLAREIDGQAVYIALVPAEG